MTADSRGRVLTTALRLFRERGYAATTMRLIATEAGVATGNAYYWFPSKGHLVQELYREVNAHHAERVASHLAAGGTFEQRLRAVLDTALDVFEPYHAFGAEFVTVALRPGSGASPFSAESADTRRRATDLMRTAVDAADPPVPERLRADLPDLLWLAELGMLLFWVHDTSPGQQRTRDLVEGMVPLVARLVRLARLPLLRSTVDDLLAVLASARGARA